MTPDFGPNEQLAALAVSHSPAEPMTSESCRAVAGVLSLVGDKWTVLIVSTLGERMMRFSELKRAIGGITQRMLTLTLRDLEREGLVLRTEKQSSAPHVEYALTELGASLRAILVPLTDWARRNQGAMRGARQVYDDRNGDAPPLRKRRLIA